jgi:D-amino-acid dehydrogenase
MMKTDVAVLGAGIVGVAAALHLQTRGRDVVLIDRRGAGEETSFGNAGIIERATIFPYLFPRDVRKLAVYAFNGLNEARYNWRDIPAFAPFLYRYFVESAPRRALDHALSIRPLIEACLDEHEKLMAQAGVQHLLRKTGWLKIFRDEVSFAEARSAADALKPFGLNAAVLDAREIRQVEPFLREVFSGAVHYLDPASVSDPQALTLGYLKLFEARGGRFLQGDAVTMRPATNGFGIETVQGPLLAREVVLCLGPWSDLALAPLGYTIPFAVKRGYHRHFRAQEGASLSRPVLDADRGYLLAPMAQGIRLTTGAEFARRDAPPNYTQVERSEIFARELFPLGGLIEEKPWMGSRPCLPDMLPVLGPAPRHKGLWFNFGHQHHGLTLSAVCGRLLAEMMTGEQPFADPSPFSIERF